MEVIIKNYLKDKTIIINESNDIFFHPKIYNNVFGIEINYFNWFRHYKKCEDCLSLKNDFGSGTNDWYLLYGDNSYIINLQNISSKFSDSTFKVISGDNFGDKTHSDLTKISLSLIEMNGEQNDLMVTSKRENEIGKLIE